MVKWSEAPTPIPVREKPDEPEFYVTVTLKTKCKVTASCMDRCMDPGDEDDDPDYTQTTADEFMSYLTRAAENELGKGANAMLDLMREYGFIELDIARDGDEIQEFDVEVEKVTAKS